MHIINHFGCIISKKEITEDVIKDIKEKTTLVPVSTFGNFEKKSVKCHLDLQDHLLLPVYFFQDYFKPKQEDIMVKFDSYTKTKKLHNEITLRENQQEAFDVCAQEFQKPYGGGVISLTTGFGKTIIGLKLAAECGMKVIVVLNKIELIKQWEEQIKKLVPEARIGKIQAQEYDIEDKDIVLATLQTVTIKKTLNANHFKSFGVCLIDEIHNISSEIFSRIMFKIRPPYIFGLTATLERKDGLHSIIHMYIGNVLYDNTRGDTSLKQSTEIHVYNHTGSSSKEIKLRDGTPSVSTMITNISEDDTRNKMIIGICKELLKDKDRNILVISDRIHQLKKLHVLFPNSSGLFIGGMKKEALELSKTKRIILATYQYVSEGVNIPKLNTLVFATPRSSITQAIGRIYRKHHLVTPVIVDINDNFSLFSGQFYKRRKIYTTTIDDVKIIKIDK